MTTRWGGRVLFLQLQEVLSVPGFFQICRGAGALAPHSGILGAKKKGEQGGERKISRWWGDHLVVINLRDFVEDEPVVVNFRWIGPEIQGDVEFKDKPTELVK